MSLCTSIDAETGHQCPFEAEAHSLYCRGCTERASREKARFEDWMQDVVVALEAHCGLHPDDLPDCPYADWYAAATTPEEAARLCLASFLGDDEDA